MAWLLLLVIFWKPAYYLGVKLYHKYRTKNVELSVENGNKAKNWFLSLFDLVKPWNM